VAWLAAQDGVASVIAGATTPDQVRANAAAAAWTLVPRALVTAKLFHDPRYRSVLRTLLPSRLSFSRVPVPG